MSSESESSTEPNERPLDRNFLKYLTRRWEFLEESSAFQLKRKALLKAYREQRMRPGVRRSIEDTEEELRQKKEEVRGELRDLVCICKAMMRR